MSSVDEAVNRNEYFIHHEDVRRAQPGWQPRELAPDFAAALWAGLRTPARLALRRTPAQVTITAPGHGSVVAGRGGPMVDLVGPPGELLLFVTGRQAHALVELAGPEEITDRMRTRRYGRLAAPEVCHPLVGVTAFLDRPARLFDHHQMNGRRLDRVRAPGRFEPDRRERIHRFT